MKQFTKVLAVLALTVTVTLLAGWGWGKKKVDKKTKTAPAAVKAVQPVIEENSQAPNRPIEHVTVKKVRPIAVKPKTPQAAAVKPKTPQTAAVKPKTPQTVAVKPKPSQIAKDVNAVIVNGEPIKESAVSEIINQQLTRARGKVPPQFIKQYKSRLRKQAIEQLVVERILMQKITQDKLTASDKEVNDAINQRLASQKLSMDDFKSLLKAYGKSFAEYKENVKKKIMFDKLLKKNLGQQSPPTLKEAKEYYETHMQQFKRPESIHARHILIKVDKSDPNADPNQMDAQAKAKAEGILKQLRAGADFAEMAKKYSDGPSAKKGGDLGTAPKGSFVPAFEAAAYALEPNEISNVVKTRFGYHIIQLLKHNDANTIPFDKAKDSIMTRLSQMRQRDTIMSYIRKVKAESTIKYANPNDRMEIPPAGRMAQRPQRPKPAPQSAKKKPDSTKAGKSQ